MRFKSQERASFSALAPTQFVSSHLIRLLLHARDPFYQLVLSFLSFGECVDLYHAFLYSKYGCYVQNLILASIFSKTPITLREEIFQQRLIVYGHFFRLSDALTHPILYSQAPPIQKLKILLERVVAQYGSVSEKLAEIMHNYLQYASAHFDLDDIFDAWILCIPYLEKNHTITESLFEYLHREIANENREKRENAIQAMMGMAVALSEGHLIKMNLMKIIVTLLMNHPAIFCRPEITGALESMMHDVSDDEKILCIQRIQSHFEVAPNPERTIVNIISILINSLRNIMYRKMYFQKTILSKLDCKDEHIIMGTADSMVRFFSSCDDIDLKITCIQAMLAKFLANANNSWIHHSTLKAAITLIDRLEDANLRMTYLNNALRQISSDYVHHVDALVTMGRIDLHHEDVKTRCLQFVSKRQHHRDEVIQVKAIFTTTRMIHQFGNKNQKMEQLEILQKKLQQARSFVRTAIIEAIAMLLNQMDPNDIKQHFSITLDDTLPTRALICILRLAKRAHDIYFQKNVIAVSLERFKHSDDHVNPFLEHCRSALMTEIADLVSSMSDTHFKITHIEKIAENLKDPYALNISAAIWRAMGQLVVSLDDDDQKKTYVQLVQSKLAQFVFFRQDNMGAALLAIGDIAESARDVTLKILCLEIIMSNLHETSAEMQKTMITCVQSLLLSCALNPAGRIYIAQKPHLYSMGGLFYSELAGKCLINQAALKPFANLFTHLCSLKK